MSDFEERLRSAPTLAPRSDHQETTVHQALHAFHRQQRRKRVVVPFVAAFLGSAACLAIAAVILRPERETPSLASEELSKEMIVQAYVELRETFPEGLAAIAFIDGEMQIYPGMVGATAAEPSYVEMKIGSKEVKVLAAQGTALPLIVDGATMTIEFMPDASGQPTVFGEDFYWSARAKFMPSGREVLKAEQMKLFL